MVKIRVALLVILAVICVATLFIVHDCLLPLFFGILIAYLLLPASEFLEKKGVTRFISLCCIYLIFISAIIAIFWIGVPHILSGVMSLESAINNYLVMYTDFNSNLPSFIKNSINAFHIISSEYINKIANIFIGTMSFMFDLFFGIILSFYIIKDREKIATALIGLIPKDWRKFIFSALTDINDVCKQFIRGQLCVGLVLWILTYIGLSIIGIKYAFILGAITGIFDIIPYFGPFLGLAPAIIVAAIDSPYKIISVAIIYLIVQQLEGAIISPKIMGQHVGLHPIITIMAVIIGGRLFGIVGMLIAVPACGIIRAIARETIEAINSK